MSTQTKPSNDATSVARVDLKFEAVVIPVSDVERAKKFYGSSGGGSTPTSPSITASAWSSSRRLARGARSTSARTLRRPRPAPPRAST